MARTEQPNQGVQTIRMSHRELAAVLEELDRHGRNPVLCEMRSEPRVRYDDAAPMVVRVNHPGGSSVELVVKPRDLSTQGMGFLNGSFLYHGTIVSVFLRTLSGRVQTIRGTVVRCDHIQGVIHDVGLKFEEPIDLSAFIGSVAGAGDVAEAVKAAPLPQFEGSMLHVDPSLDDRDLMTFLTSRIGVIGESAGGLEMACELISRKVYDLIVVDLRVRDRNPLEFPAFLRGRQFPGPIVALTLDPSPDLDTQVMNSGFNFLLRKPLRQSMVTDLAQRYLNRRIERPTFDGVKPLFSEHWSDAEMRPIILKYLSRLEQNVKKLSRLLKEGNLDAVQHTCAEMGCAAAGYGFPVVVETVASLAQMCGSKEQAAQISKRLEELVKLCESALMVKRCMAK